MPRHSQTTDDSLWTPPSAEFVFFCLHLLALPLELLLHRFFGRRYIGWSLPIAAVCPVCFAQIVRPQHDPSWAMVLFPCVLVMGVSHKLKAIELDQRESFRHSKYCGEPWLATWLRVNEVSWKCLWEPLLCAAGGFFLMQVNESLGMFVILSAAALRTKNWLRVYHEQEARSDLQDAYLEQRSLAEQLRGRIDGN